ncbi:MAG: MFS transporter [Flavobacteriales bacterium]|nr:MFS transporter [Flavobacteriales bacterium]
MDKSSNRKVVNAWAFYDWANSAYPLVITTAIFPMFYEAITTTEVAGISSDMVSFWGMNFKNTELYSYVASFSFLVVSLISPLLSGIADYTDSKKEFLQFFCYLGAISCGALFFFDVEHLEWSMLPVFTASVGFWGSIVFYNAYLPQIAPAEEHDRISAKGYSLGYVGSSILLIANLVMIMGFEMDARWAFVSVAIWWIAFAQVTYRRLPRVYVAERKVENKFTKGWKEVKQVWLQLKEMKTIRRYLISFFVFSMGVQTVMLMATLFAAKEIEWGEDQAKSGLIISVLIIQFVAIGGAYLLSWLSARWGNIKALSLTLFIWIGICVIAWFIHTPVEFYFTAALVGLVMGGIQSLSRSTYSKLIPETKDYASFFSFYDVLEKLGIVIGTFSYGFIEGVTGSMRNSIIALISFFILGLFFLYRVPRKEVIQATKTA